MGCRIINDRNQGIACLYCSTSGWAFGPTFEDEFEAQEFCDWLNCDPRILKDDLLAEAHAEWFRTHHDASGEWTDKHFADDRSIPILRRVQQAEQEHERRRRHFSSERFGHR